MSLRTFRPTLAATALTMALSLLGSSPARAADAPEPVRESSFWESACEWVESWAAAAWTPALSTEESPATLAGHGDAQDAGWTIDPDG